MTNIIILGKPGCGKGTVSKELEKLGYFILGGSDVLRENSREESATYYKEARHSLDNGVLISSELINLMVTDKVHQIGKETKVVLDGYPRTLSQSAHVIGLYGKKNLKAFYIDIDDKTVLDRIEDRIVCKDCAAPFSVSKRKEDDKDMTCDHCGGELYKRKDDNSETVSTRLVEYETKTAPLISFLRENIEVIDVPKDQNSLQFILKNLNL